MSDQTPSASQQPQVVGQYMDQQAAEQAYAQLLANGFSSEQVHLTTRQADPPITQTRAVKGAKGGALIGGVFGGLMGLVYSLSFTYQLFNPRPVGDFNPIVTSIGITLLGSLVGSIALGLIGALAGVNAPKETVTDLGRLTQQHVLMLRGSDVEIKQAMETLQQLTQN